MQRVTCSVACARVHPLPRAGPARRPWLAAPVHQRHLPGGPHCLSHCCCIHCSARAHNQPTRPVPGEHLAPCTPHAPPLALQSLEQQPGQYRILISFYEARGGRGGGQLTLQRLLCAVSSGHGRAPCASIARLRALHTCRSTTTSCTTCSAPTAWWQAAQQGSSSSSARKGQAGSGRQRGLRGACCACVRTRAAACTFQGCSRCGGLAC